MRRPWIPNCPCVLVPLTITFAARQNTDRSTLQLGWPALIPCLAVQGQGTWIPPPIFTSDGTDRGADRVAVDGSNT